MKQLTFAIIGAGQRGNTYGDFLLQHPHEGRVVAVADAHPGRLASTADKHSVPGEARFASWEALLDARPRVDAVVIATQDRMHTAPTLRALAAGYDVLLEKPISPDPAECLAVAEAAERHGRVLTVCHVLRYTPYMTAVKRLLDEGAIGRLLSIQWTENVGWYHQAHSFVRGNWRNSAESSPMILAKSCHDLDLLHWLAGAECQRVSSFGSLSHFRAENAPPGAPHRCTDGCPVEHECAYSALKIYNGSGDSWLVGVMTDDRSPEGRLKALKEGPYGRCVYHCDNDVVDHQVVNLAYANGVTVSFTMTAFSKEINRTAKLFGTEGEMRLDMNRNEIQVNRFLGESRVVTPAKLQGGHNGGDGALMRSFLGQVRSGNRSGGLTSARVSASTHLLAFAAEESRLSGQTVDFPAFVQRLTK